MVERIDWRWTSFSTRPSPASTARTTIVVAMLRGNSRSPAPRRSPHDQMGCRARQSDDGAARVQDRPRPDEPHAGDDLAGHACRIRGGSDHGNGEMGVQNGTDTDENVGAQAGWFAAELALHSDRSTELSWRDDCSISSSLKCR